MSEISDLSNATNVSSGSDAPNASIVSDAPDISTTTGPDIINITDLSTVPSAESTTDSVPRITINDLLASSEVLVQKEMNDKGEIENIIQMDYETLKSKLLVWATAGFPNAYEIAQISVIPPDLCSDGTRRNLTEYITFVTGKTLSELVNVIASKVTGMNISFANMNTSNTYIAIVVNKL